MLAFNALNPVARLRAASAALLPALGLALTLGACAFEEEQLESRRCLNDAACVQEFGPGFICGQNDDPELGGFCQSVDGSCGSNADCDDGIFCTSDVCEPGAEGANAFGCVITARDVDDGIACTVDACDEDNGVVVHDTTDCECTSANDRRCEAANDDPCKTPACDLATLTCTTSDKADGESCDDGIDCTINTTCQAGACTGNASDAACDDGQFCNGAESCRPDSPVADARGCAPGTQPASVADGPSCADAVCDEEEDEVRFEPTLVCECSTDADCRAEDVALGCALFACGDDFTCSQVQPAEFLDPGATCDDGFECTREDTCGEDGQCRGTPVDALCDGPSRCDPFGVGPVDARGCTP